MQQQTVRALRSLDAAPTTEPDGAVARAVLERILATPPVTPPVRGPSFRPSKLRWALVSGGVTAMALAGFLVLDGENSPVYASWSAVPATVGQDGLEAAQRACEDVLRDDDTIDGERARLVLAERRGDHVALLYRTEVPDLSAICFLRNPSGSSEVDDLDMAIGGSSGPTLQPPPKGFTQGAIFESQGAALTDGAAGRDVVAVTIHAGERRIEATVEDGRYAAWWPGSAFDRGASDTGDLEPNLRYDLTLRDGTVLRDVQPTRPT